jgi:hypothetical protein
MVCKRHHYHGIPFADDGLGSLALALAVAVYVVVLVPVPMIQGPRQCLW